MSCCNSCASGSGKMYSSGSGKMYSSDRFGSGTVGDYVAPDIGKLAMNAAVTGLIASAEGYLVYGSGTGMLVPGLGAVSAPVGFGVHTALASVLSQYADAYQTGTYTNPIIPGGLQQPVFTGVGEVLTQYLAGNSGIPMLNSFLIGSTSQYLQTLVPKAQ